MSSLTGDYCLYCPSLSSDNKSGKFEQWIGWVGLDKRLNIGLIEGNSVRDKRTLDQFSCESPSLTFHNGIMYVSWVGLDHRINIATFAGSDLRNHTILSYTTDVGSCVASHNNQIYVAWKSEDPQKRFNVGKLEGSKLVDVYVSLMDSTPLGPSIASHNHQLYVAWVSDDHRINVGVIEEHQLIKKVVLEETTHETPCLAVDNNELKIIWIGDDLGHHLNIAKYEDGRLTHKSTHKGPYTESIAIVHGGMPTLHFGRTAFKITRSGTSGVRYNNGTFAYGVHATLPEPKPTNPHDKELTEEWEKQMNRIYLVKL